MNKAFRWNRDIAEGILFLIAGAALFLYCVQSYAAAFNRDLTQSPYLFPGILAVFFVLLAISLINQGVKANLAGEEYPKGKGGSNMTVLVVMLLSAAYFAVMFWKPLPTITFATAFYSMSIANFEIATGLYLLAVQLYLGVRKIPVLALVSVLCPVVLSLIFRGALHVLLP